MADPTWLDRRELTAWTRFLSTGAVINRLVDQQLKQDSGLSHPQFEVLARLADSPDGRLRMTELAGAALTSKSGLTYQVGQLEKVYEATRAKGVAFLGIDVRDSNVDAPRDFVIDRKVSYPSIYDPPMRTMIAFGGKYPTTVIPSTVVLDRDHRVAAVFLRELLAEDLQPVVDRLAAEPVPEKTGA